MVPLMRELNVDAPLPEIITDGEDWKFESGVLVVIAWITPLVYGCAKAIIKIIITQEIKS